MACEYCEKNVAMPINRPTRQCKYIAIGSDGIMRLLNDYTVTRELVRANYCWNCGEKLGDADERA